GSFSFRGCRICDVPESAGLEGDLSDKGLRSGERNVPLRRSGAISRAFLIRLTTTRVIAEARNKTSARSIVVHRRRLPPSINKEITTMSIKTQMAVAVAIVLGTASAALAYAPAKQDRFAFDSTVAARAMARSKQVQHSSNSTFDVYGTSGRYIGSDPDPF